MLYYSTANRTQQATFKQAVMSGLAPDGGLYMPCEIPRLPEALFKNMTLADRHARHLAFAHLFCGNEIPERDLADIILAAISFPAPLHALTQDLCVLELFHGPTLAFKDFGARFMAGVLRYFVAQQNRQLHILVATSGDTGGAVAAAFHHVPGISVHILFPSGRVSELQELQLTTLGGNIFAYEVSGSFDDCQRMVKAAFIDQELLGARSLGSANSINIARLLPQAFYYLDALAELDPAAKTAPTFVVPSGNFGNLCAGLLLHKSGAPIADFVAATNANDVLPEFLNTNIFSPRSSRHTLSNAMDVGNPSNFARLQALLGVSADDMRRIISAYAVSDELTLQEMREIFESYDYLIDPHTAVGVHAALHAKTRGSPKIVLATAHPAKFPESYSIPAMRERATHPRLEALRGKPVSKRKISKEYQALRDALMAA